MFPYLYQAYIHRFKEESTVTVRIDLGFHVGTRRQIPAPDWMDPRRNVQPRVQALVTQEDDGAHNIRLLVGADGEPELPPAGFGPPELWRYPAKITNVVDADTVDADIHVGFDVIVRQRLRLAGIQAPEGGKRAADAMGFFYRRLRENRFQAQVVSSRHGKWRRWLAEIYFADSNRTLNQELVDHGYAVVWDGRSSTTPGVSRMLVELSDQTRGRLTEVSATEGLAPGQVAGRIVSEHFENDPTDND